MALIFVDTEADGPCPGKGVMTEFGAVELETRQTFHGVLWEAVPDPSNPAMPKRTGKSFDATDVFTRFDEWLKQFPGRPIFVSDNPASSSTISLLARPDVIPPLYEFTSLTS